MQIYFLDRLFCKHVVQNPDFSNLFSSLLFHSKIIFCIFYIILFYSVLLFSILHFFFYYILFRYVLFISFLFQSEQKKTLFIALVVKQTTFQRPNFHNLFNFHTNFFLFIFTRVRKRIFKTDQWQIIPTKTIHQFQLTQTTYNVLFSVVGCVCGGMPERGRAAGGGGSYPLTLC